MIVKIISRKLENNSEEIMQKMEQEDRQRKRIENKAVRHRYQ